MIPVQDNRGVVLLSWVGGQDWCSVSRGTVWRMINEHGLKVVRWAVMASEVDAVFRGSAVPA